MVSLSCLVLPPELRPTREKVGSCGLPGGLGGGGESAPSGRSP
jgi:hypothetical protein